ncbi:hypothetical protein HanRHA438_Chr01g0004291 [Helianthus annuus]|nr:hypothetical protein HanRHA438_Chr01g0004291 [Helianthus annuus]
MEVEPASIKRNANCIRLDLDIIESQILIDDIRTQISLLATLNVPKAIQVHIVCFDV